jgi:uncharacterized damage-inducible protein DinB
LGAFTYPRSEPGSAGHQDLVEKLNAQILKLQSAVAGLPDATLSRPNSEGWSIKDIVGHLCDVSQVLHERLRRMISLEEPHLASYDAEALKAARSATAAPIEDVLAEYATKRRETVDMLSDLVHWNWARPGRHPKLGRISIRQQVELWLDHEDEHLAQIRSMQDTATAS